MTTHTDRYGREVEHSTTPDGERFDVAGLGTVTLPAGTTWSEARERIEAMAPPQAEVPPVPDSIPAWKGKVVLHQQGLLATVEAAIAGADPVSKIAWGQASDWSRQGSLLAGMAAMLGLTEAQVDDLFRAADAITV